jgi:glycine cleavage system H protein
MSKPPIELKYLRSHEWARLEDDGESVTVGITDYAQDSLGDVVYVENPAVGTTVTALEQAGVIESVKAASDINSPVSGEVIAVNTSLEDQPELVNQSPYTDGWLFKVKASDISELNNALSSSAYEKCTKDKLD